MATSGSVDFSVDRDNIITEALSLCGVLADGETATTAQITSCSRTLNLMAKSWQTDGLQLWLRKEASITLVTDQQKYLFGPSVGTDLAERPLKIIQAWRRTSNNEDIPIHRLSEQEYITLTSKGSKGVITNFFYRPSLPDGEFFVWPVHDGSSGDSLRIIYQRPIEDFDAGTNDPDFPQEWHMALAYGLAWFIAPKYGVDRDTRRDIRDVAILLKNEAKSFDTEDASLMFVPSPEGRM